MHFLPDVLVQFIVLGVTEIVCEEMCACTEEKKDSYCESKLPKDYAQSTIASEKMGLFGDYVLHLYMASGWIHTAWFSMAIRTTKVYWSCTNPLSQL